jgi:hypothetical protein
LAFENFLPSDFYTVWQSYIHIADYLKDLADRELEDRKLIIVGIPRTGQRLVDLAFDLATRSMCTASEESAMRP